MITQEQIDLMQEIAYVQEELEGWADDDYDYDISGLKERIKEWKKSIVNAEKTIVRLQKEKTKGNPEKKKLEKKLVKLQEKLAGMLSAHMSTPGPDPKKVKLNAAHGRKFRES